LGQKKNKSSAPRQQVKDDPTAVSAALDLRLEIQTQLRPPHRTPAQRQDLVGVKESLVTTWSCCSPNNSRNGPAPRDLRIRNTVISAVTAVHNKPFSLRDGQGVSSTSAGCDGAHSRASAIEGDRAWVTCCSTPQTSAAESATPRRWMETKLGVLLLRWQAPSHSATLE
jgi:hypothetical protein